MCTFFFLNRVFYFGVMNWNSKCCQTRAPKVLGVCSRELVRVSHPITEVWKYWALQSGNISRRSGSASGHESSGGRNERESRWWRTGRILRCCDCVNLWQPRSFECVGDMTRLCGQRTAACFRKKAPLSHRKSAKKTVCRVQKRHFWQLKLNLYSTAPHTEMRALNL